MFNIQSLLFEGPGLRRSGIPYVAIAKANSEGKARFIVMPTRTVRASPLVSKIPYSAMISISADKIPCFSAKIACSAKTIPCSVEQGIRIGRPVTTPLFAVSGAPEATIL